MTEATLVADLGELESLEADWRALAVERGNAFLTPDWARATADR